MMESAPVIVATVIYIALIAVAGAVVGSIPGLVVWWIGARLTRPERVRQGVTLGFSKGDEPRLLPASRPIRGCRGCRWSRRFTEETAPVQRKAVQVILLPVVHVPLK